MWDNVFGWSVVVITGPGIVLLGFGVLSMTPAEYKFSLWCFAFGYLIILVKILSWILFERTEPTWERALFIAFVCAATGILWFASSLFALSKKEPCLKSVLVMKAWMEGSFGPKEASTKVALDVSNPPEEAIQNVDLIISRASKLDIMDISEVPPDENNCKPEPINLLPEQRITFKGADGDSRLTINSREMSEMSLKINGSQQWRLTCPRWSGRKSIRFALTVRGDAQKDSIQISGTYECIPSKGSAVVKVNNTIPITK
jgi:hypothetical protein